MSTEQKIDWFPPKNKRGQIAWKDFRSQEYLMAYIQMDASGLYGKYNSISDDTLINSGSSGLRNGIQSRYPGGLTQLKADIGLSNILIRKPKGFWTPEQILTEAEQFYREHQILSSEYVHKVGRSDLYNAVSRYYPGSWKKLIQDVGVEVKTKQSGYWTEEKVEIASFKLYKKAGELSNRVLVKYGEYGLRNAIRRYPGKIRGLKLKLKVSANKDQQVISLEEANRNLEKLFED